MSIGSDKTSVWIPSKGRPDFKTAHLLQAADVPYTVVVEPQDEAAYKAAGHPHVVVLPENDRGICYARNFMLDEAKYSLPTEWHWFIDDDITGFTAYNPDTDKHEPADAYDVLMGATREAMKDRVVIAGLEMAQFAWSAKGKTRHNTQCIQCVLINVRNGWFITYPDHYMEDREICMSAIASGYRTARYTRWAYRTPPMGSNKGGCQSFEQRADRQKAGVDALVRKYGEDVVKPVFKPKLGWWDCRINWRRLQRARHEY